MTSGSFGDRLRREREMRGVSLEEITAATRISTRFLLALENEQWNQLPGGVFNRGFIRSVARYLGLDEEALLAEYALATNDHPQVATHVEAPPAVRRRRWPWVVGLALALLAAGGWYAYRQFAPLISAYRNPVPAPPAPAPPTPDPEAAAAFNASLAAADLLKLKVEVTAPTSVRVVADGKVLLDARMARGERRTFEARDSFEVFAANASAVFLEFNGLTPPLEPISSEPGAPGRIRLDRSSLSKPAGGPH
jgi:transcriptional regulator with XRE-family HTH domain